MAASIQTPHTVTSYDDDLHRLRSTIGQMGALCEGQLVAAIDAVVEHDAEAADAVVALDGRIDALHAEAEGAALSIIARHAPLAEDLREVVATLKIAGWLERVGDYAKSIAKRASILAATDDDEAPAMIGELATAAKHLLRQSLNAYVDRDDALAAAVIAGDRPIDRLYEGVFNSLLAHAGAHGDALTAVTHLQFIAKSLERIADQATNIAEQVRFAVTGAPVEDRFDPATTVDDARSGVTS